ncbi:uncharacterized protein LOC131978282 isoform X2 [Centropristis striata]|uniref:uncharacterized protein LOC131978282 isoform X2 n=1 Tax=Centropristis striata TaxID=184440 RepID=UPI0027E1B96B|nr:uncharacterized protein LOC131978282 isoform X2 [Centropristis striata]
MIKEKKTKMVEVEKHDPDTCPMIVSQVKKQIPKMRTVKSKKIKVAALNNKLPSVTTCESSGNIMKLCVNLMPVLAAAKEPEEEEESNSCTRKKETSCKNHPSVTEPVEQTLSSLTGLYLDTKQPLSHFMLPPITEPEPAARRRLTPRRLTPLPPILLSEQSVSSEVSLKGCRGNGLAPGPVPDSRPWIDNPLFSKSRSPEFRLPDISLSSLDALLQTVTQKLRRRRRVSDEGQWRRVQSDPGLREKRITEESRNLNNIEAVRSVGGGRRRLPPLLSAPEPTLIILTMTKKTS